MKRRTFMKFEVNERCIGCGLCVSLCPEVFEMLDTGIAHAKSKAEGESIISLALEAKESCPVEAIESK